MTLSAISAFGDEVATELEDQIAGIERQGIRALELRTAWGTNVVDLDTEQLERTAGMLRAAGFAVSAIGSPVGKAAIDGDLDEELGRLRAACAAARRVRTKLIRVFSFYIPEKQHAAFRDEVLRRMSALARVAAAEDVILVHENESFIYGDDAEHCRDLIESVESPALQAAFDPANFVQVGVRPFDEAWPMLAEHVVHFHVKDASAADRIVRPAGEGDGQVAELLHALESRDYRGHLVIEPHLQALMPDADPAERFAVAVAALRRLLGRGPVNEVDLSICVEPFESEEARRLVAKLDAGLAELYAPEQRFGPNLKAEHVDAGRGVFLVARVAGTAVGCGAIRVLDSSTAEVKRMYVEPDQRGKGVGWAVLQRLEAAARELGVRRLVLETGIHQEAAIALYRRAGFNQIDCWGEYLTSPTSVCFGKDLG